MPSRILGGGGLIPLYVKTAIDAATYVNIPIDSRSLNYFEMRFNARLHTSVSSTKSQLYLYRFSTSEFCKNGALTYNYAIGTNTEITSSSNSTADISTSDAIYLCKTTTDLQADSLLSINAKFYIVSDMVKIECETMSMDNVGDTITRNNLSLLGYHVRANHSTLRLYIGNQTPNTMRLEMYGGVR